MMSVFRILRYSGEATYSSSSLTIGAAIVRAGNTAKRKTKNFEGNILNLFERWGGY